MDKYQLITEKIVTLPQLLQRINNWRFLEKKIVFTNGCFDIIHRGHTEYLAKAANFGDVLIIGLNTDNSVKRLKGKDRPLQDEYSRAINLAAMQTVRAVVLFDEGTPYELIKQIQPDVLVKGADYKAENIVGYDIVTQRGGSVETIELVKGLSTTNILKRLQ